MGVQLALGALDIMLCLPLLMDIDNSLRLVTEQRGGSLEMIRADGKLSRGAKAGLDLVEPLFVDNVLLILPVVLVLLHILIKDRGIGRVSIVDACYAVPPATFHCSVPLAEQDLVLLERVELCQLLFDLFDLITEFLR